MIKRLSLIFLAFLVLQACTKEDLSEAPVSASSEKLEDLLQSKSANITESPIPLENNSVTFVENIPYGIHDENVFDIFIPESDSPVPLVIYIHGGGFISGSKEVCYEPMWDGSWDFPSEIDILLSHGIAFATIKYRLLAINGDSEGIRKPLRDSKRCLQFIRKNSAALNIDKSNIVLCGSSAGAGTAQWLAFQDDLADLSSQSQLFQESTRVKGIALKATQASYDLRRYETDIFADYDFSWQNFLAINPDLIPRFKSFYGLSSLNQVYSAPISMYRERVDMLAMMSPDDPEFWVENLQPVGGIPTQTNTVNHHAFHARTLKEYGDSLGIPNVTYYGNPSVSGTESFVDPSGETFVEFIIRKTEE